MRLIIWGVLLLWAGVQTLWADEADIALTMRAEKATKVVIDGQTLIQLKPVRRLAVGDILTITIAYRNQGDSPAANIHIDNPVPPGTHFVLGSGFGRGALFMVSYDNGRTFEEDIHIRKEPVTHVRWEFDSLPAGVSGEVGFQLHIDEANVNLSP